MASKEINTYSEFQMAQVKNLKELLEKVGHYQEIMILLATDLLASGNVRGPINPHLEAVLKYEADNFLGLAQNIGKAAGLIFEEVKV